VREAASILHASEKRYSATGHLSCTFTGPNVALCDGQFAFGGSMLLVQRQTITFTAAWLTVGITRGPGSWRC
jgi:hypothetical protein